MRAKPNEPKAIGLSTSSSSSSIHHGGRTIRLERTANRADRRLGLLHRASLEGALLIDRCRMVHTMGMRFAIDVAYARLVSTAESETMKEQLQIVGTHTMRINRFGLPRIRANCVLEAEAGSFAGWGLSSGQTWLIEPDFSVGKDDAVEPW